MHTFLSYNRADGEAVGKLDGFLTEELRPYGISVWRDDQLRPGVSWQPEVVKALDESCAVVICVGPAGLGPTQEHEVQRAMNLYIARKIPVILVRLHGARELKSFQLFVEELTWVEFTSDVPKTIFARPDFATAFARLVFGITGDREYVDRVRKRLLRPLTARSVAPPSGRGERSGAVSTAVSDLGAYVREECITLFVGTGAAPREPLPRAGVERYAGAAAEKAPAEQVGAGAGGAREMPAERPPAVRRLPRTLLRELRLIPGPVHRYTDEGSAAHPPPERRGIWLVPGIDVVGDYYIAKNNPTLLEEKVRTHLPHTWQGISRAYREAAVLSALLYGRPEPRGRRSPRQLIVSTNYDNLLECALLVAGVPFTRVVQYRSGRQAQIERFRHERYDARHPLPAADEREQVLRQFEAFQAEQNGSIDAWLAERRVGRPEVVRLAGSPESARVSLGDDGDGVLLYKPSGSADVRDSCAISTDHLVGLLVEQQRLHFIPDELLDMVATTPALFIGFWPLDPDLRLVYHLFREQLAFKEKERILLPYWPRGRESTMRAEITEKTPSRLTGMRVVDASAEEFLSALVERAVQIL